MSIPAPPVIGHRSVACLRKRKYGSEAAAWSMIFRLRAMNRDTARLQPYQCDFCHEWHLGRRPTSMAQKIDEVRHP